MKILTTLVLAVMVALPVEWKLNFSEAQNKAIADHKAGKAKRYESAEELFKDLGI